MDVIIQKDRETACALTARLLKEAIEAKPYFVLGLATGRTMERLYALMAAYDTLDWSQVTTFNLDEYIGLSPDDPHSYRQYMEEHLFSKVNIAKENTHLPNGIADNIDIECEAYEKRIDDCGGIDLQLLGIGRSGHIGFNEPLSALRSRTRAKALTPETIAQNAPLFPKPEDMPRRAVTMGVGTILDARRCIMLVTGEEKADIIAKAVEGPVTSMISATAMQLHPKCTVIVDEAAATKLEQHEYYRWTFANEPEWESFQ